MSALYVSKITPKNPKNLRKQFGLYSDPFCWTGFDFFDKSFGGIDFSSSIDIFLKNRKINTDAMQDLSMHNFIVMRDKTGDKQFLLQKKIEALFTKKQHKNSDYFSEFKNICC